MDDLAAENALLRAALRAVAPCSVSDCERIGVWEFYDRESRMYSCDEHKGDDMWKYYFGPYGQPEEIPELRALTKPSDITEEDGERSRAPDGGSNALSVANPVVGST